MANVAKQAILRAKLSGVLTDLMVKTITDNVYLNDTTTLTAHLATLAAKADLEALQTTVGNLGALASKDKVAVADLEEALAALINGKAEASALTEEINRAKAAEEAAVAAAGVAQAAAEAAQADVDALEPRVTEVEGKVTTLVGEDAGKSARAIAAEETAKIVAGADTAYDTLKEIADWISTHGSDAATMQSNIVALQNQLKGIDAGEGTVKKYIDDAITALNIGQYALAADLTALAARVTTAEGKITALETAMDNLGDMAHKDIVSESDLSTELAEKVNAASEGNHAHLNKDVIDGITAEKVAAWDAAEGNAKAHANELNEAMAARMTAVEGKAHEHANKDVLDGISADLVSAWNGKSNIYYSAEEPANMAEGDLWVQLLD